METHWLEHGSASPVFFWRHACVLLEVFAEEALVGEVHFLSYFFDGQCAGAEEHTELKHDIIVNPLIGCFPADLPDAL